ncbi:LuxR C-terminal-related transcriptional regulator [uncultured Winogradskyella sp.]|uniref:helix-turn-helix and ligand-binding sensor domain-containing protein n=1 Tax=Winogradskyella sp. 4-2091 TaxID=3381659 RepID=UPI0026306E35|nr:LuxR C-terminal-related transcriptional regulator [uncultured Winogradskyella sp.]
MIKRFTYISLLISCLFFFKANAQFSPQIQNYSLAEYKAANQNWDITRSEDGYVYVANNNGLLVYDALNWKFYQLPNKTTVRSVFAHNDLIFTGSYEEFGYWKKDEFGILNYNSLSDDIIDLISPNEEIWQIVKIKDKIIFRSFLNIYIYDFKKVVQLRPMSAIISCNVVDDKLYVCTLNKGIFSLESDELKPFYFDEQLADTKIVSLTKFKDGLLVLTSLKGSYYLYNNELKPAGFEIDKEIKQHQLNKFAQLTNGEMVFGTIKDGVIITDSQGKFKSHVSKENGLLNNTVLGQFIDASNNLWLGLDNGISKIDLDSQHYFYNDQSGKLGAVYDVLRYKGSIYIGSNTGLFRLDENESLQFIEGSQGQVWDLKIIEDQLFCGHNEGTFIVDGDQLTLISDFTGGWTIKKVPESSHTYIQGTYTGLVKFKKNNDKWIVKHLGKTTIPSRFLVFENPNTAWVAHAYKGLYRIKFDANYDSISSVKSYSNKGIVSDFNLRVYNIKNNISFKTNDGWQKYEPIIDSIIPYNLLNEKFGKESYIISEEDTNQIALINKEGVISLKTLNNNTDSITFGNRRIKNRYVVGYENVSKIEDSIYGLNLVNGFMMMENSFKKNLELVKPKIQSISINKKSIVLPSDNESITLEYGENLELELTSPKSNNHYFEYNLSNNEDNWYRVDNNTIELTNLIEGDYKIKFVANNDFGNVSPIQSFEFEIKPPWYRGALGILLYILIFALAIIGFFYVQKRKVLRQQRLIKIKYQKEQQKLLREKTLENEKRIVQLKNDALQNDIKLKSKQLANNAMALVKKNESLQEIKKELMINKDGFQNYYAYKKLLKRVDNSIVLKDEWEVFEYNFNQVHDEFFVKLKQQNPKLTPKDLKICAYIKMNLSSKEIAPLLNISVRGVETHRYRLKKKLNLENDTSIVDYLLNIK